MDIPNQQAATTPTSTKFSDSEITELATIREAFEQITVSLGQLEMQKRDVKKNEQRLSERLTALEIQEKSFLDGVVAKYGEGTFDIATGIFTPKKV